MESVAARDAYFPEPGREPDPWEQWMDEHPALRAAVDHAWELIASR
jgi:hypothetical protein